MFWTLLSVPRNKIINLRQILVSSEQSLNTGDHMLLISILNALITWSCLFYLLCDYGELVTDAFEELNRSIFDISWYACSADAQKMVLMMIRTSQQAVRLKGYGSINCSRDMFKQVNGIAEKLAFSTRRNDFFVYICETSSDL